MYRLRKHGTAFADGMNSLWLAGLFSVLLFLLARVILRSTLTVLPLLTLTALLLATAASHTLWRLISTGALMTCFFFLEFTLNAAKTPFGFFSAIFYAVVTVLTAELLGRRLGQLMQERAYIQRQYSRERSISSLSAQLLTAADPAQLYDLTLRSLYSVTDCPTVLFLPDGQGGFPRRGSYPEGLLLYPVDDMIHYCFTHACCCGRGAEHFRDNVLRCFPIQAEEGRVLAVAGLLTDPERPLESYPLDTVESLLVRCGVALDRMDFINREQKILMEKELEHMRSDFLRAISHDFRTPLTGIIGACSTLEQPGVSLEEETSRGLIHSVSEEAAWLLRMVENLLTVTRVGPSGHKLNRSLEPLEEVLLEVLEKARGHFPQADIRVQQPADLLLIPMDPTLMVQVLTNLIENAVKFSDGDHRIDLIVEEQEQTVTITVRDYGRGLSEAALKNLFEPINHHDGDSNHGMGLGLSICKSIIRAHGGTIEGRNIPPKGAVFIVTLPKEETYESYQSHHSGG